MNLDNVKKSKLIILEGVPGSGKNTIQDHLIERFSGKLIYQFGEREMLFSWKHGWIPDIDQMRLNFYENFLSYCEDIIQKDSNALFLVNRFHISYKLYTKLDDEQSQKRYVNILERIKNLRPHIIVPLLEKEHVEKRTSHIERVDPIWQQHLQKRLEQHGFTNLHDMYTAEQEKIKKMLAEQAISYDLINFKLPNI